MRVQYTKLVELYDLGELPDGLYGCKQTGAQVWFYKGDRTILNSGSGEGSLVEKGTDFDTTGVKTVKRAAREELFEDIQKISRAVIQLSVIVKNPMIVTNSDLHYWSGLHRQTVQELENIKSGVHDHFGFTEEDDSNEQDS